MVRDNYTENCTDGHRDKQLNRRGRYVDFNLLHDGDPFSGRKPGGNVPSILSSRPPE